MNERHTDTPLAIDAATAKTSKECTIDALIQASPSVVLLRDGELVLYRRTRSLLDQCRFKLADGKWRRFSTRRASLGNAMALRTRHDMTADDGYVVRYSKQGICQKYLDVTRIKAFASRLFGSMARLAGCWLIAKNRDLEVLKRHLTAWAAQVVLIQ
ncbi:MAG: hypothetical protein CFE38_01215 [Comamonadaceae bacterium PBBC1]|nr:MAG: hypothetical protein CFE38_01215 [Comamonadaceae bacterium PBBC1]